jgi:hypothetical protein
MASSNYVAPFDVRNADYQCLNVPLIGLILVIIALATTLIVLR